MSFSRSIRRIVARGMAVTLLTSTVAVVATVSAAPAHAATGTVLFNQPFHDNTVDGPAGAVSLPKSPTGTNSACLTAAGNSTANPLASCSSATDAQSSGKLRFTSNKTSLEGGVFANNSVPTSQGLDVTFNSYQYGGTGADGIAFVLAAVDPANPATPATLGQPGGALGYSAANSSTAGLTDGYLGVGIDAFGNFSNKYEGSGCTDPANIAQLMPRQVVVRGPGNGTVGYCAVQSSAATATSPGLNLRATTRSASLVPVEVVINPTSSPVTTSSGLTVPAGDYDVNFTPIGGTAINMLDPLPVVPAGLYPSSWVTSSGIPKQLAFGWVASTGGSTDYHEIDNVLVTSLNPVPQLAVSQTSYAASSLAAGSPVTYTVAASSSGAAENSPVTVTETLPSGVLPVGASGPGWVCGAPSGQQISCTKSASPFTAGTITVNGVVTSSSVTPALIQSSSTALVSSADGSPATSSSAPAGALPAAPTVTSVSPTNGAAGGGNDVTVTGTNLSGATAIEIGTAAEFTAGTPTTLNLCTSSAPGCFTVTSSTSLDISSMPGHAAASVTVRVVSLGVSGSGSYTYNSGPALLFPAPPGGEVGVAYSDQLTVTGGTSPFTWSVSAGSLPPGLTLGASTGLLSGTPTAAGSYSFTVQVTDHAGLTSTEPVSLTVIPGPSLSFAAPPAGWTHTVYSDTLTESGGTAPFTWSVSSGSLPAGISLSADGNLTGTPTAVGTSSFTVKVTDANGQSATQATSISIAAGVSTTFAAPPAGVVGAPYSDTLTATGGTTPYTWSVNAGSLPPGITLSAAGVLAGTPTTVGSYTFTVNVIDKNGGIATASITLVVTAGLAPTFSAPPSGQVGVAYTDTLTAVGGTTPYTWSVSAGTLPTGITLNAATGVLAGTPTAGGIFSFTVKVTDATGLTATSATSITILAGSLTIAATANVTTTVPGGSVGYTVTVTNSGPIAYTGATFTDGLSGVLDDAAYNSNAVASAGTVSFTSPSLTWTGNLAVGASVTITFSVTVNNPDTGNKILASTVTSTTTGSNCASGSTDPNCSVSVPVAVLTIAASASPASATPGTTVSYTITVTNAGQVAYTGAAFTDALAGVLDDASFNNNATATAGSVVFTSPNLTWTGNLAAGASATITFSVTVNSPDTGDKVLSTTITSGTAGSNCASGSTDSRCATSVPVQIPGLTITVSANTGTATPGSVVGYTVTVVNSGQTAYTGASFTDPLSGLLDDAAYNNDAAATVGTVSFTSPSLTWTGNLAVGASATVTFSVTVKNPDTGDKILVNTVTSATAGNNCPAGSTDPRCTSSVSILVPGLTISQSAGISSTTPGGTVHYTVTVTNSGQTPATGATFTDPLGDVLDDASYNGDASATAGTVTFTSPNLSWTGSLAVGATATITFSVTVKSPDTGNHILASTITSTAAGSNCASGSGDARCTATVAVSQLTIVNSAGVSSTVPGGVVRFTATFSNTGQTAYTGITIFTSTADVLDDATANGDQTASSGTLSVTATGISWTGSIPVGGTVTVTGTVTVNNPDLGNKVLAATIQTAAPGSNCPAGGTDPACSVSVPVLIPALTLSQSASTSAAVPGQTVSYTVTVANTGQTPYTGVTATDTLLDLGDAVYNNDAAATSGTVSYASPVLTWTGDLAVGATVTITFTMTVRNPDPGDKTMTTTVASTAPGANCPPASPNPGCSLSFPVLTPALTITAAASAATAPPGGTVGYTITVANTGQTAYTGISVADGLAGVLDDAAYDNDATATAGAVSFTSPTVTWTGNLAVGATATITFSVKVNNPDTGDGMLTSTLTSAAAGNNCPPGSTDPRCATLVDVSALSIVNTASTSTTTPGGTVDYTITIANTGQTTYTGAAVTDPLDGILDDAAFDDDADTTSGDVSYASPNLTWTGTLAPGAAATITFSVTVNSPDTGDHTLTSTITSPAVGSNCPAGGADPRCTASVTVLTPGLTITKTASASSTTPGAVVGFTITVQNTGQTPYTAATVTDPLSALADDSVYNGDATASSGTVSYASPVLTWTGALATGATATITFTVTVRNPDTGDKQLVNTVTSASAGSNCLAGGTDPLCTATVTVLTPGLTITKTASASTVTPGTTVSYTITVADTGQTPYTTATVQDSLAGVLDDASYNGDAAASTGSVSYAEPTLTWTGSLTPGQTATISYSVTVINPDTGDRVLTNSAVSAAAGSNCPAGSADPRCTATITIVAGQLSITVPASAFLGSGAPGGTVSAGLGTVQVTDTRGFGADWTATVSATSFTTGTGTPAETIPVQDATYNISALIQSTGTAIFRAVPTITLNTTPQTVVSATNVAGNTSASWNPLIVVSVPATAVAGTYTATITHSVA
jgi:large repetitive protein